MISEIVLRSYTPQLRDKYILPLANAVRQHTDLSVFIVDHTDPSVIQDICKDLPLRNVVCLDRHLSNVLNTPCTQISRVFSLLGKPINRLIGDVDVSRIGPETVLVDTDAVTFYTMNLAKKLYRTDNTFVLMELEPHQDLIDIEDLVVDNSCFSVGETYYYSNYLINEDVFSHRTSLPKHMHQVVKEIVKNG